MNKEEKIKKEIEKTLGLFENVKPLEPNPFLYTRIQQKINEQKKSTFNLAGILKPALFTLLFSINVITLFWYSSSLEGTTQSSSNESLVEILSSDFNLDSDNSNLLIVE